MDAALTLTVSALAVLRGWSAAMLGGLILASFDRIFAERLSGWLHALGNVVGTFGTFNVR